MDPPVRTYLRELLLDLANDASAYLRTHAQPAVRISAALLIAASLAACSGAGSPPAACGYGSGAAAQPLSQEVRSGLPSAAGTYPLQPNTLSRDGQGVYHFLLQSGSGSSQASVSRLRLAPQSNSDVLEVPATGDPILHLRSQASIPLCERGGSYYGAWRPFYGGIGGLGPAYYDPPSRAVSTGSTVDGSHISSAPSSPGDRTVGAPHTVSGRAGGTGSGSAASIKSGAGTSGGDGGAAAAKSGGFSGGRGGGGGGGGSAAS
jgi:hypothetical protein